MKEKLKELNLTLPEGFSAGFGTLKYFKSFLNCTINTF